MLEAPQFNRRNLFALPVLAGFAATTSAGETPVPFRPIQSAADDLIAKGASPGLMVAVAQGWRPVFAQGFGSANLECATPVQPASVFHIGSMTKQFTAAAILRLQELGRLSIADPLSRFYPDFPGATKVRLRHLLTHTSGIHNFTEDFPRYDQLQTQYLSTGAFLAYLEKQPIEYDFDPGTAHHYSNTGFWLLGAVIEKVTGETYQTFLKREIIDRAHLTSTDVDRAADIVPHRASGYDVWRPGVFRNAQYISMSIPGAAGALRSTAGDLLAWHRALFAGDIVSAQSLATMLAPARLDNGALASSFMRPPPKNPESVGNYGMGLIVTEMSGEQLIKHPGAINGFTADTSTFPRLGLSLAVLSNGPVADEFTDQVLPGLLRSVTNA